jgi:hypothetical protein
MKLRLLALCLLTIICVFGQETVLKGRKGESYYVLKDNPKIKYGPYQNSVKKIVVERGQYENDKKLEFGNFMTMKETLNKNMTTV